MKNKVNTIAWIGIFMIGFILTSGFKTSLKKDKVNSHTPSFSNENLREDAFEILEKKCNVCHRKQNPFMVFNKKNMTKRAKKIYQMVFLEQRMPKGSNIRLNKGEYSTLKKWLMTQEIY